MQLWKGHLFGELDIYLAAIRGTGDKIIVAKKFNA